MTIEQIAAALDIDGSLAYKLAYLHHKAAAVEFRLIREGFRARKISDAEFIAARKAYDAAAAEFDAAYEAEQNGESK